MWPPSDTPSDKQLTPRRFHLQHGRLGRHRRYLQSVRSMSGAGMPRPMTCAVGSTRWRRAHGAVTRYAAGSGTDTDCSAVTPVGLDPVHVLVVWTVGVVCMALEVQERPVVAVLPAEPRERLDVPDDGRLVAGSTVGAATRLLTAAARSGHFT